MTDIIKNDQDKIVLAEIEAGIDLETTDLVCSPGEYWLPDESDVVTTTGYTGVIADNMWKINGSVLETDSTGTDSENWEFDGLIMQAVT